ncbi:hypothetical protein Glove_51g56 [Diversispora epigaea]|uniref:Kelch repeat protein n=1 Tax=Diversispora epigaea TaxID=1348612 RepID=A0A397JPM1_9GLOM|nr:hypothetical protein Glove_51g56 [Diversispora epigaea]
MTIYGKNIDYIQAILIRSPVIINNRLLIFAGWKNQSSYQYTYELFYLDLSISFDNTDLPWTLIPDGNLPIHTYHSTAIVGLDNSTIFLIRGLIRNKHTLDYDFSNQVYTYDYLTSKWTTPSIIGDSIPPRQQMKGVIDNSGIIYFCDYSADILPNGIIYIGGQENTGGIIKLFDTRKLEWTYMNATGVNVDSRWLFSSVFSRGCLQNLTTSVSPILAVLDTNKSPYEWSIPSNSKANSPPSIWSFDNTKRSWTLIPTEKFPTWASTAIAGLDNSDIFEVIGYMRNKDANYSDSNLGLKYEYTTSEWIPISITGGNIPPIQKMKGVIDNSGIIYIFGGINVTDFTIFSGQMCNDMNTSSMTWRTLGISENLLLPTSDYSANILPNGIIVYIGGQEYTGGTGFTLVKMKSIKLFDTKKLEWIFMNATAPDGYIVIFGGCTLNKISVSPNLAVLDTNKSPYEWSIPSNSKANSPPSIYGHSANLHFDYMIIAFGKYIDTLQYDPKVHNYQLYYYRLINSKVYLYNITSNTWVASFNHSYTNASTSTNTSNSLTTPTKKSSKGLVIGLGLGISAVVVISSIFAITFILRRKKRILEISDVTTGESKLDYVNDYKYLGNEYKL